MAGNLTLITRTIKP